MSEYDETPRREDDPGCGREVRKRIRARRVAADTKEMHPYR